MEQTLFTEEIEFGDKADDDEMPSPEIPKEVRKLRTQAYDKSVIDIIRMIRDGDLILDPDYQRNYVWDNKKASLLMESILLNVPIPVNIAPIRGIKIPSDRMADHQSSTG